MKNKNVFLSVFVSISFWIIIVLLCIVFLHNCSRPHFFTISMADENLSTELMERKGVVEWSQLEVDSLNVIHLATNIDSVAYLALRERILREEIKIGRLMTAEQMSENITGYYDKLIDVLIALFIIFSIISYFVINNKFKEKYEEDKITIVDNITRSLLDSQSLHEDLVNGISTKIEKHQVTEDDVQELRALIEKIRENYELLAVLYDDLAETATSKEEIVDVDNK